MSVREITIGENEAEQRFDRFVRKLLDDVSLSAIYRLMRTRKITLNQRKARPETRLKIGDVVTFHQAAKEKHFAPKARARRSERRDFKVVHEDGYLLCVDKPAGLLVHAGNDADERGTLIAQVTDYLMTNAPDADDLGEFVKPSATFRPGLVHRLDRQTSGLVLVGKTLPAMQTLSRIIKKREIQKTYLALACGAMPNQEGEINVPIRRREKKKQRERKVDAGSGQTAVTRYRVLGFRNGLSLLEVDLITGRTHQIRAHLRHVNAPLAGDPEYGDRTHNTRMRSEYGLERQFLHAARLRFTHPDTDEALDLRSPLWPDLRSSLDRAGFNDSDLPRWLP